MVDLQVDDLRFSLEETNAFLKESHALDSAIPTSSDCSIGPRAGSPGCSSPRSPSTAASSARVFIQNFSGTDRDITDYLASDVLMRQPQALRDFLLKTAVLERMSADLCDHVTGLHNSADTLARIERGNLFLVALDEDRRWFRYHHLFADFLRSQLRRRGPELEAVQHRRAAAWFASNGAIGDAIHHALEAGDPAWAADKLEALALDMVKQSHVTRLQEWLRNRRLRSSWRPRLLLGEVWATFHISRPLEAARSLTQAKRALACNMATGRLSPAEQALLQAELRMLTVGVVSAANRPVMARRMAERWRAEMPADQPFLTGTLSNIYAFNSRIFSRTCQAHAQVQAGEHGQATSRRTRSSASSMPISSWLWPRRRRASSPAPPAFSSAPAARPAKRLVPAPMPRRWARSSSARSTTNGMDALAGAARPLRGSHEAVAEAATVVHEVTYRFCLARLEAAEGTDGRGAGPARRADPHGPDIRVSVEASRHWPMNAYGWCCIAAT